MDNKISKKSKVMMDLFCGKFGNEYTERNLNSDETNRCIKDVIYNIVKMNKLSSVCEIGCNIGNNLSRLESICSTYGVDINKNSLKKGKEKYPFINFIEGSIYKIPFEDNKFDLVFTRGVLIHIPPEDQELALKELKRISKKYIVNIEYPVENDENNFEAIKWRDEQTLWRVNTKKYWDKIDDVKVKDYFQVDEKFDKEKNWICIVEKKS